uniref:Small capsomere-interacting protein n=1 Tax=Meloidogyne hapla TaxID=6305 RepID=A0A1I8C2I9_MELHA
MENPSQIRSNVLQGVSTAVLGQLQNKSAMRKVVKRIRLQQQEAPRNPAAKPPRNPYFKLLSANNLLRSIKFLSFATKWPSTMWSRQSGPRQSVRVRV